LVKPLEMDRLRAVIDRVANAESAGNL